MREVPIVVWHLKKPHAMKSIGSSSKKAGATYGTACMVPGTQHYTQEA